MEIVKNSISRTYKHISQKKNSLDWFNNLETIKNRSVNLNTDQ